MSFVFFNIFFLQSIQMSQEKYGPMPFVVHSSHWNGHFSSLHCGTQRSSGWAQWYTASVQILYMQGLQTAYWRKSMNSRNAFLKIAAGFSSMWPPSATEELFNLKDAGRAREPGNLGFPLWQLRWDTEPHLSLISCRACGAFSLMHTQSCLQYQSFWERMSFELSFPVP